MESLRALYYERAELGLTVSALPKERQGQAEMRYAQHRLWVKQREQEWNAAWDARQQEEQGE